VTHRRIPLAALPLLAAGPALADEPNWLLRSRTGMVAADHPEASQIGADVLRAGGNAFDAAVAVSFALTVARPESTGIGGGGFLVGYVASRDEFVALDFREAAPAAASPELYEDAAKRDPDGPPASVYGGLAVGVPGQVAGLEYIAKHFGTRPLRELAAPAVALAQHGFLADETFLDACNTYRQKCERWPVLAERSEPLGRLANPATAWKIGDRVPRAALAETLQRIGGEGAAAFYRGPVAQAIVDAVNQHGGRMTLADLSGYEVKRRTPLRATVRDFELISMPPPSSGGVCLIETLQTLDAWYGPRPIPACTSPADLHVLLEAFKHAFADRARWLADADHAPVPVEWLTSRAHAATLAARIDAARTGRAEDYGGRVPPDDAGTSHFCIADREGNLVAMTETVNATFGSFIVVEPFGVILNNEMDDLTTRRGEANFYGLTQSDWNLVAPGKRPLSSMTPTIVRRSGKPLLLVGGSGGPRIISSTIQIALRAMAGVPLQESFETPRAHHQWKPDEVFLDRAAPPAWRAALTAAGHTLSDERRGASVQAILFSEDGEMRGACDPRKGGAPAAP